MRSGLVLLAVAAAAYLGRAVQGAPGEALFLPTLLLVPLILRRPVIGLYLFIPVGQLVPYWVRVPVPVLDSPLALVGLVGAGAAMAYWASRHVAWPRTPLYWPLLIIVAILGGGALIGYGAEAGWRLYITLHGLLPFFLVILLIDSPRKARILLLCILMPLLLRALAVWPIALFYGGESGQTLRGVQAMSDWLDWLWGFRGGGLVLNLSLLVPFVFAAMVQAPHRGLRLRFVLLSLVVTGALVLTTYRAALLNLGLAAIAVVALGPGRLHRRVLSTALLLGIPWLMATSLGNYLPGPRALLDNWQRTVVDPLAGGNIWVDRLGLLRMSLEVFRRSPWVGVGAITPFHVLSGIALVELQGQVLELPGHSSIGMIASEYGITLLLAWSAVFLTTAWTLVRLYRAVHYGLDRALVVGLFGVWLIIFVQAFINNTLFQPVVMHVFWAYMGLAVVWDGWLRRDPDARLVDWQW